MRAKGLWFESQEEGHRRRYSSSNETIESNMARQRQTRRLPPPGPEQCHPRIGSTAGTHGCLPESVLKEAARKLRLTRRHQKGKGHVGGRKADSHRGSTMNALARALNVSPKHQRSLLNALPISEDKKKELAATYLRPAMPSHWKPDMENMANMKERPDDIWLDSLNIEDVMKQYEETYPWFEFMGPFPIDFAAKDPYADKTRCIIGEMCGLNLKEQREKGKRAVGFVFNLDPHYKEGSHWIAAYIDIPRHRAYYFDSYGMEPPAQIRRFMQWLTIQDPRMKLAFNGRRFQYKESECGMYCLYFIIRMLMGDSFRRFIRRLPPDSYMLDLRDHLYSN
jgi:Ulp1 protease family, C-terminal catalytic domain